MVQCPRSIFWRGIFAGDISAIKNDRGSLPNNEGQWNFSLWLREVNVDVFRNSRWSRSKWFTVFMKFIIFLYNCSQFSKFSWGDEKIEGAFGNGRVSEPLTTRRPGGGWRKRLQAARPSHKGDLSFPSSLLCFSDKPTVLEVQGVSVLVRNTQCNFSSKRTVPRSEFWVQ